MIQVSKDAFYAAIGPEDARYHPERDLGIWTLGDTRLIIGKSYPGYVDSGLTPKTYYLANDFAAKKGIKPVS